MKKSILCLLAILGFFTFCQPTFAEPWLENAVFTANLPVGDTSAFLISRFEHVAGVKEVVNEYRNILKKKLGFCPSQDVSNLGVVVDLSGRRPAILGYIKGKFNKKKLCETLDSAGHLIVSEKVKSESVYRVKNKKGRNVFTLYPLDNNTVLLGKINVISSIISGKNKILETPADIKKNFKSNFFVWASAKNILKTPIAKMGKVAKIIGGVAKLFEEVSLKLDSPRIAINFKCTAKGNSDNLKALLEGQIANYKLAIKAKIDGVKKPTNDEKWLKSAFKYMSKKTSLLVSKSIIDSALVTENNNNVELSVSLPEGLIPDIGIAPVAIIGVAAAIAIPNFKRAREKAQQRACFDNQRLIMNAVKIYNLDNKVTMDEINSENLKKLVKGEYLSHIPTCPSGGVYSSSSDLSKNGFVKCSKHGSVNYK